MFRHPPSLVKIVPALFPVLLLIGLTSGVMPASVTAADLPTVLITGSNRGIGL